MNINNTFMSLKQVDSRGNNKNRNSGTSGESLK